MPVSYRGSAPSTSPYQPISALLFIPWHTLWFIKRTSHRLILFRWAGINDSPLDNLTHFWGDCGRIAWLTPWVILQYLFGGRPIKITQLVSMCTICPDQIVWVLCNSFLRTLSVSFKHCHDSAWIRTNYLLKSPLKIERNTGIRRRSACIRNTRVQLCY